MYYWPGYGFQAFKFRTGYINQENNVGNRIYNYIILINSLIQVAINFLERHMDTYRIRVILFSAFQFRTGYQNQAKSSLEQGQVSGGPVAHPHQNFCLVLPPLPGTQVPPRGDTIHFFLLTLLVVSEISLRNQSVCLKNIFVI